MYAVTRQEASNLYQQAEREETIWRDKAIREFSQAIDLDAQYGNSGFTF